MATSQGGLRIMAGAGAKKDPATEAVAVVPGGDVKEAVAASAEVAPPTASEEGDAPPPHADALRPRACFNLRDRDAKRYRAGAVAERACRVALDVTRQINHEDARLCTSNAHLDAPRRAGDLHLASRHADEAQADGGACVFIVDRAFVARAGCHHSVQEAAHSLFAPHRPRARRMHGQR